MIAKGKSISHGAAALENDLVKQISGKDAATEVCRNELYGSTGADMIQEMKPYFAALMLSVSVLPAYAGPLGTADKADLPQSNVSSPMMAQSLRQPDLQPISTDRKTECFRLYTPDRKPGVNCVPDGSTGH